PQPNADLCLQQFQHAVDASLARRGEAVEIKPPDRYHIGPKCNSLDHVGATAEPAIHDDLCSAADCGYHLLEAVDCYTPVIELPATMIGDIDAVDAVVAGDDRIFRGLYALDNQRQLASLSEALDLGPAQRRLIALRSGIGGRSHNDPLRDVPLAAAVDG